MIDSLQIILLTMLMVVIIFFIILGVQVYFLIKDFRQTITKANKVLDSTNSITDSISEPISALSGLVSTVSAGTLITKALKVAVKMISKTDTKKKKGDDDDE